MAEQADVSQGDMVAWSLQNAPLNRVCAKQVDICKRFGISHTQAAEVWKDAVDSAKKVLSGTESITNAKLLRENQNLRKQIEETGEILDLFAKAFREVAPALPAYRKGERKLPKLAKGRRKQAATMMANWSDWQLGERVEAQHIAGLGEYNWEIAKNRLRMLRDETIIVHDEWTRPRDIPRLVINVLGDLIQGDKIFNGMEWFLDLDLSRQCQEAVFVMASLLRDLAIYIPQIDVYCVPGNHGRLGGRKSTDAVPPSLNAEVLFYRFIQHSVSHLEGVHVYVAQCPWLGYQLYDRNFLLSHGHQTSMWNQIPWYGLTRDTMRLVAMTQVFWHYHMIGHFHQPAEFPVSAGKIIANGSLVGPSLYTTEKLKSAVPATQKMFMVHPEHGISWRLDLEFEPVRPLTPDAQGLYTPVEDGSQCVSVKQGELGGW